MRQNDVGPDSAEEPRISIPTLRTPRLVLRPWRESDLEPFAVMNADPEVMRHFPSTLSRSEAADLMRRIEEHFRKHGFGPWAVEIIGGESFIGFTGIMVPEIEAAFTPCIEVGWRIAREHWGKGYAPEAARAALGFGFNEAGLEEIVSFTVEGNRASRRVMEKLGMTRDPADDFDHPHLPPGDPLRRHVLYRLGRKAFLEREAAGP